MGVLALEKRSQPRFNIELALDYAPIDESENLPGTVVNANEGGILVYLPERLAIGDLFKIRIFFPTELEFETIQAIAKVVWADCTTRNSSGDCRYGLELQSFLKGDLEKFRRLLKKVNPEES